MYGIRGHVLDWFASYISNRVQYTNYKRVCSRLEGISCGVPQGSILGPLLFIIYMNDLYYISDKADVILFADDTSIFFSNSTIHSLHNIASNELNIFCDWFSANKLSLNIKKTNYIIFDNNTTRNWEKDIIIDGTIVKRVTTTKFLGVHIDSGLTWRDHISAISKKISVNVGILSKLKHSLPSNILLILYKTLVLPHLHYCNILWSGTNVSNLHQLTTLQKRAIRHVAKVAPRDHTSPLFRNFNLLKFTDIIYTSLAVFTYKAWNGLLPAAFNDFILSNTQIHTHNTRHSNFAHRHHFRTNIGLHSLRNRASKLWNTLTEISKDSPSLSAFKKNTVQDIISSY